VDIDAVFLPTADSLINQVFPTPIVYHRHNLAVYDGATGEMRYLPGTGSAPVVADYQNAEIQCVTLAGTDFDNSDAGDGTTSLCVDSTLPAGTIDFDNADIDPRDTLIVKEFTDHSINAGILNRSRADSSSGVESYALLLWVEHKTLPLLPDTADRVTYDNTVWRVMEVAPTYSSKGLIASKLKVVAS
jgi:hypothetical protein